jgi:Peptidase C13 family
MIPHRFNAALRGAPRRQPGPSGCPTHRGLLPVLAATIAAFLVAVAPARSDRRAPADVTTPYQQTRLVDRALAALQPAAPGHGQLYFVGFAGFGSQAVFRREVIAVRQLFDERFGTAGRSIALINSSSTIDEAPLATAGNLDRVLRHLGSLMEANDSLFLFLTSHGDRGFLAVEMPGTGMDRLTSRQLKAILDRSGIKHRVIVISACHSGSFISTLADPTTLVIAAARADRSSFGCEDRRRWTYFGEAYFNQALRQEDSFTAAFQRARKMIALWEARERRIPSLPQIAGGEGLVALPLVAQRGGR